MSFNYNMVVRNDERLATTCLSNSITFWDFCLLVAVRIKRHTASTYTYCPDRTIAPQFKFARTGWLEWRRGRRNSNTTSMKWVLILRLCWSSFHSRIILKATHTVSSCLHWGRECDLHGRSKSLDTRTTQRSVVPSRSPQLSCPTGMGKGPNNLHPSFLQIYIRRRMAQANTSAPSSREDDRTRHCGFSSRLQLSLLVFIYCSYSPWCRCINPVAALLMDTCGTWL